MCTTCALLYTFFEQALTKTILDPTSSGTAFPPGSASPDGCDSHQTSIHQDAGSQRSNFLQGSGSPVSTQNSATFQRRQRRKLRHDDRQAQQTEDLRRDAAARVRRLSENRKSSDSYSWIERFVPLGTKPPFNIFNVLLDKPELMLQMTNWLDVEDLISLYAISKDFHIIMNTQLTTMILGNARSRAPECAEIFRPQCYKSLCIYDPAQNMNPVKGKDHMLRDVPSLRWLRFVHFREQTVDSIIRCLAAKGQRLPRYASKVLKKIWLLMDVATTSRRAMMAHNPNIWSDVDLYIACMFFMKLDMACSDPVDGNGERGIPRLLMAQRSLSKTDEVLRREAMQSFYELYQMHVEWKIKKVDLPPLAQQDETCFGVNMEDLGRLGCQGWVPGPVPLMRPDEVVMKESLRRRLHFEDKILDLILWGNLHPVTDEDVFPTNSDGEIQTSFDDESEQLALRDLKIHASRTGTQIDWDEDEAEDGETTATARTSAQQVEESEQSMDSAVDEDMD